MSPSIAPINLHPLLIQCLSQFLFLITFDRSPRQLFSVPVYSHVILSVFLHNHTSKASDLLSSFFTVSILRAPYSVTVRTKHFTSLVFRALCTRPNKRLLYPLCASLVMAIDVFISRLHLMSSVIILRRYLQVFVRSITSCLPVSVVHLPLYTLLFSC